MVATAAALVLLVVTWRRAPLVAWSIGWAAVCVATRFVFASNEFIHEYQFYPAFAGLSLPIGAALAAVWPWPVRQAWTLSGLGTKGHT